MKNATPARPEIVLASVPLLTAIFAVLCVWAAGFTERSLIGTALEDYFYGYFFRSYPVLLFAMIYGAVRIVAVAVAEPGRWRGWRVVSAPAAMALFLVAGFHPTFGGMIARPAFATGGMSFLQGHSADLAALLGAGAAALMYGLFLGVAVILARLRMPMRWKSVALGVLHLLALWLGAVALLHAQRWALDPVGGWPLRPLPAMTALKLGLGVGAGLLPHAIVVAWNARHLAGDQAPTAPAPDRSSQAAF